MGSTLDIALNILQAGRTIALAISEAPAAGRQQMVRSRVTAWEQEEVLTESVQQP